MNNVTKHGLACNKCGAKTNRTTKESLGRHQRTNACRKATRQNSPPMPIPVTKIVGGKSKTKPKLINHIALLIDDSGSMCSIAGSAKKAFNTILDSIEDSTNKTKQETTITLINFGLTASIVQRFSPATIVEVVKYNPKQSGTCIFTAVELAIETLESHPDRDNQNASFLVIVVTDGLDNYSGINRKKAVENMKRLQATDRWTFAFQLPSDEVNSFSRKYSIPVGNVKAWDSTTDAGSKEMGASTQSAIGDYYVARSAGATSSTSFFLTTNLSNVKSKDLNKLTDVTASFKTYQIGKDVDIDTFITDKRGIHILGQGYYLLMKKETVQPNKAILIMKKGEKKIYGGSQARSFIGLPSAQTVVTPGNHADYDIYIQSTSNNRRLVRGTKLLVNLIGQYSTR